MPSITASAARVFPARLRIALGGTLLLGCLFSACSKDGEPRAGAPASTSKAERPAAGGAPQPADKGATQAAPKGGKDAAQLAYQTALTLLLRGDPKKAEAELQRATQLDSAMSEAHFELGKLRVHLSSQNVGSSARNLDILQQGIASLKKALELEPSNDQYAYWLGRAYHLAKNGAEARTYLEQAVKLNPKNADAHKRLGMAYVDAEELELAKASFEQAIEHDPKEAGAFFQLGQTLELLGDRAGARASYERAIEVDRTQPEPYGSLTKLLAQLGDDEAAAETEKQHKAWLEFDEKLSRRMVAVNQNPSDAAALRRLGEMYLAVGKWADAQDWFLKAVNIDPRDAQAHLYCGIARRELQDYEMAMNHLKEAEFLAPDNLDPKLELLRLYAETKDEKSLAELVAQVETEASQDGPSLWALAEVCQEVGRGEDAQRLFEKARALGVTESSAADAGQ